MSSEITYDMDNPPKGVYALLGGLYVEEGDPLQHIWHTQSGANLRKRRLGDQAITRNVNITSNDTSIDLRHDGDVYHALGPFLYRRDAGLETVWSVAPNQGALVSDVAATGGSGPVASSENRLYLYDPSDGSFRWSRQTPSAENVSAVTADDSRNIYATESVGETVKYKTTRVVAWRNTDRFGDDIAAYSDDHVYVSARGANNIAQLDASDGTVNWNRDGDFIRPSGIGVAGSDGDCIVIYDGGVARLDVNSGSTVWGNTSIDYQGFSTAVSARNGDNVIVFGNNKLGALDQSTGAEVWSLATDEISSVFDVASYPSPGAYHTESWS